jgi:NAD(P)-dependent dehydrogenase (short-subunit alcohol dehydrogenase family)
MAACVMSFLPTLSQKGYMSMSSTDHAPGSATAFFSGLFSLEGTVALVTGAGGALAAPMTRALARAGAKVALLDRQAERTEANASRICEAGGEALAVGADVLNREALIASRDRILARWGRIDILVNLAGGNVPAATVPDDGAVFDVPLDALREAVELNLLGTILPCQVFGERMARQGAGCIVNISSMAAQRPLTRVVAYSAAKSAVENFTRWLAVEMARKYGAGLRVNAIAPGFFIGDQNRALLLNPDDSLTARGQQIIAHTPAGRFGDPDDLLSTLIWLCGPGARFVTGIVVPVDGGFSAFGGV